MKTKIILFLSVVMLTFACKNSKNSQKSTGPETYRVIVSFISKASGPDTKAITEMESYLISFGKKIKKTITYDKVPWGKEGEVDYCFKLKNLSKSKRDDFVKGMKNVIKSNTNVFIKENSVCTHKR